MNLSDYNDKYLEIYVFLNIWEISKKIQIHISIGIYHCNQSVFNDGDGIMPKNYLHSESKIFFLDKKYLNRF